MSAGLLLVVWRKEVLDNLRDRRTLLSAIGMAVLMPALFIGMMSVIISVNLGDADKPLALPVVGLERAPNLIRFLRSVNINASVFADDPVQAVESGAESLVLVIGERFPDQFRDGHPAVLEVIYDSSGLSSVRARVNRLQNAIRTYSLRLSAMRLQARGIDPSLIHPVGLQETDTASPAARAMTILSTMPYLIILTVFMGAFYLAIDTTAGERENGSLEPLLTQPVDRAELVLGKVLATSTYAGGSLLLTLCMFALGLPFIPFDLIGLPVQFGFGEVLWLLLTCLPLVLVAASGLTVVAAFTRSFKEAQTYLTVVVLIPTLPLIIAGFASLQANPWTMAVPSLSHSLLINGVMAGDPPSLALTALSMISSALLALLLCRLAVWLYSRENILGT